MTVNLTAPNLQRLFSGPLMADELERRYLAGIAAVYRLEPSAFGPDLDPAASIMTAIDLTLPVIDWDSPSRVDGITPDQQRITVLSYAVTGDRTPLTWVPGERQIGNPPERFGITSGHVTIVLTGNQTTAERVATATARIRRHVDANRAHQTVELLKWRDDTARRIRDAVKARRALLDTLPV